MVVIGEGKACPWCGTKNIVENARFCTICGKTLEAPDRQTLVVAGRSVSLPATQEREYLLELNRKIRIRTLRAGGGGALFYLVAMAWLYTFVGSAWPCLVITALVVAVFTLIALIDRENLMKARASLERSEEPYRLTDSSRETPTRPSARP